MVSTNSSNLNNNNHGDEPLLSQKNEARSETATSAGGASTGDQQGALDPDEPLNWEQRFAARARAAQAGRTFQMAMGLTEKEREMVRREGEIERLRAARRSGGQDSAGSSGTEAFGSAMRGDVGGVVRGAGGAGGTVASVERGGTGGMMEGDERGAFGEGLGGGERGGVGGRGGRVRGRGVGRGGRREPARVGRQIVDLTQDDDEMDVDESG
ncbi:hypothetical protein B0J14DRAFT_575915 [Halenospora varia]|nr:hypothetical protein B0J14DRAFT_575915 [Halenospora varia]